MKALLNFILILMAISIGTANAQYKKNKKAGKKRSTNSEKICTAVFESKSLQKMSHFCKNSKVQGLFYNLTKTDDEYELTVTHRAYFVCMNNLALRQDYIDGQSPVTCSDMSFRTALRDGSVDNCLEDISTKLTIHEKWRTCKMFGSRKLVRTSSYSPCISKTIDMGISSASALSMCKNSKFRVKVKTQNVVSCMNNFPEKKMFNFDQRINICGDYQKKTKLKSSSVKSCIPFLKGLGFNSHLLGICISKGSEIARRDKRQLKSCIKKGLDSAYGNFFSLETKRLSSQANKDRNSYYYLVSDCLNLHNRSEENEYFSYVQDINIHSNQDFIVGKKKTRMYGLSALRYNNENKSLVILSDSRYTPKLFKFDLEELDSGSFKVTPKSTLELNPPKGKTDFFSALDPEGLILMSNGDLIISSEQQTEKKKLDLIFRYSSEGDLINTIDVPEDFVQKVEKIKEQHKSHFYDVKTYGKNQKTGKKYLSSSYTTAYKPYNCRKPTCVYEKKVDEYTTTVSKNTQGMDYNKGLESLGITEDEAYIFTANESTLVQDRDSSFKFSANEYVRIVRYDNSFEDPISDGQFLYRLESEEDNGLVDILPISKNKVLTLERSYDQFKNKITARIFLVDLSEASDVCGRRDVHDSKADIKEAKKTELIDLDSIRPSMSPGFKKLDNFEGMSFGPTLKDGSRSLILVSDNNNSLSQRTIILMLKVKKAL